jgi:hypothetical protein
MLCCRRRIPADSVAYVIWYHPSMDVVHTHILSFLNWCQFLFDIVILTYVKLKVLDNSKWNLSFCSSCEVNWKRSLITISAKQSLSPKRYLDLFCLQIESIWTFSFSTKGRTMVRVRSTLYLSAANTCTKDKLSNLIFKDRVLDYKRT